jgi:hypothetical protein
LADDEMAPNETEKLAIPLRQANAFDVFKPLIVCAGFFNLCENLHGFMAAADCLPSRTIRPQS